MKTFCGAFPLLPGKTETGREFAKACMGPRRTEFAEALKRHGVTKESWFLQKTPQGDMMIVYFEAEDVEKAFETIATSKRPVYGMVQTTSEISYGSRPRAAQR